RLTRAAVGDVITYQELSDVLELDPQRDRQAIRSAVYRAAQEYEEQDNHSLDAVHGLGYRVVAPSEHIELARRHQQKAHDALARSHSKVVHVDESGLSPSMRAATRAAAALISRQMDFNRRFSLRQDRLEEALSQVSQRSERSEEELAHLRERLDRLERLQKELPER